MADEIAGDTWGERLILKLASRIRETRRAQDFSVRELAERTSELGHPISRQTLVNLEAGRRGTLSIDDLIVIAHALGVNPMFLMFDPRQMGEETEMVPGFVAPSWMAYRWFTMQTSVMDGFYEQDFDDARYLTRELTRLQENRQDRSRCEREVDALRRTGRFPLGEEMTADEVAQQIDSLTARIQHLRDEERSILEALEREGVQANDSWWSPEWLKGYSKTWFADG